MIKVDHSVIAMDGVGVAGRPYKHGVNIIRDDDKFHRIDVSLDAVF